MINWWYMLPLKEFEREPFTFYRVNSENKNVDPHNMLKCNFVDVF